MDERVPKEARIGSVGPQSRADGKCGPPGRGVEEAVLLRSGGEIWLPLAALGSSRIFQGREDAYFLEVWGCHTSFGSWAGSLG